MTRAKKIYLFVFLILGIALVGLIVFQLKGGTWGLKNFAVTRSESGDERISAIIKDVLPFEKTDSGQSAPETTNANDLGSSSGTSYPVHKNISTTYFWIGEAAGEDNKNISNFPSAWDEAWVQHFGGIDDPKKRKGFLPAGFVPKENPFYFALPYSDFDNNGNRRKNAGQIVYWAKQNTWTDTQSMLKNQWIAITKNGKTAYAQWEDVGPFGEDDSSYVFGSATPKSKENDHAGLDVSPAVRDYLGLSDIDKTDWKFVNAVDVPDGPWKDTITTSQTYWK